MCNKMNTNVWIVLVVIVFIYCLFIFSKQQKRKKEIEKKKEEIEKKYVGRNLYKIGHSLFNEDFQLIPCFENSCFAKGIKSSTLPTRLPIIISSIQKWIGEKESFLDSEFDLEIDYIVCPDIFEFEIVYVGDVDAIAKSPKLGDIYLSKEIFFQYIVGKKIKIRFNSKEDLYGWSFIITPEIIEE